MKALSENTKEQSSSLKEEPRSVAFSSPLDLKERKDNETTVNLPSCFKR